MTNPEEMRERSFTDLADYPGPRYQPYLSIVILLLAGSVFTYLINVESALVAGEASLVTSLLVFLVIGFPRFLEFKNISRELVKKGNSTKKRGVEGGDFFRVALYGIFYLSMILAPFTLLFFIPIDIWLGSVMGLVIGFSASQLLFTLHIRLWERANSLRLKKFTIWTYDEDNKRLITEFGVRSEKN